MLGQSVGRHAGGDPAVAQAGGPLDGGLGVAADQDRDRPLDRSRFGVHGRDVPELAVELDVLARSGPYGPEKGDVLVSACAPAIPGHVHGVGFLLEPADADPVEEPTARVAIDRRELAGVQNRVADGQHGHCRADPDPLGDRGHVRQRGHQLEVGRQQRGNSVVSDRDGLREAGCTSNLCAGASPCDRRPTASRSRPRRRGRTNPG